MATKLENLLACGLLLVALVAPSCTTMRPDSADVERVYFDVSLRLVVDQPPETGFYIEGTRTDGSFWPQGQIRGDGGFGTGGNPGWVELTNGAFHGDQTGRAPQAPYVRGFLDQAGLFKPRSRTVDYGS